MYERFSDRALRVAVLAQEEARSFNHNYIGTEHILAALISEGGGRAYRELRHHISLETVHDDIQTIIGAGMQQSTGSLPWNPRAQKVLQVASEVSLESDVRYIGTEHILYALIRHNEGVGVQILRAHTDIESLRRGILASIENGEKLQAGDADKLDWGHGSNKPVLRWSEEEVRQAMRDVMPRLGDEAVIDLVINKLKENRR